MTVRSRSLLAAALGLCLALPLAAQEPAPLSVERGPTLTAPTAPSANQQVADSIADCLRQSGQVRHYDIDVRFQDGTAELCGAVADQSQRAEVCRLVQAVPGVERIVDHLTAGDAAVSPVQAAVPLPGPPVGQPSEPMPLTGAPAPAPCAPSAYAPPFSYAGAACPCPGNGGGYVGPAYPFPKIPLGWASVKLQWQDGHWWIGKTATQHDWWRYRYW
jgi:hypothetical protein